MNTPRFGTEKPSNFGAEASIETEIESIATWKCKANNQNFYQERIYGLVPSKPHADFPCGLSFQIFPKPHWSREVVFLVFVPFPVRRRSRFASEPIAVRR